MAIIVGDNHSALTAHDQAMPEVSKRPRSIWFMPVKPYRWVLIALGVFILVAVLLVMYYPAYREYSSRKFLERMEQQGIRIEDHPENRKWDPQYAQYVPRWLDDLLEKRILDITIVNSKADADCLREVLRQPHIRSVEVLNTPAFDDDLLGLLCDSSELSYVSLNKTAVTAQGLRQLKRVPSFRTLHLGGINLSLEDLQFIESLPLKPEHDTVVIRAEQYSFLQLLELRLVGRAGDVAAKEGNALSVYGRFKSEYTFLPDAGISGRLLRNQGSVNFQKYFLARRHYKTEEGHVETEIYPTNSVEGPITARADGSYEFQTEVFDQTEVFERDRAPGPERVNLVLKLKSKNGWYYVFHSGPHVIDMKASVR